MNKTLALCFCFVAFPFLEALGDNNSKKILNLIFAMNSEFRDLKDINACSVICSDSESSENAFFFDFSASLEKFEKISEDSPIKIESAKGPLNTLVENYKNDLIIVPSWFQDVINPPSHIFYFCWVPFIEDRNTKTSFGRIDVRIDAYKVGERQYHFYGIALSDYVPSAGQRVKVKEEQFTEANYLGLTPK